MNKSYIIYGLAVVILTITFFHDGAQDKLKYTSINATDMFLEENVTYKSTKIDNFSNNSLKGQTTLVFFGYSSCPDFCPDTLAKSNQLFELLKNNLLCSLFRKPLFSLNGYDKILFFNSKSFSNDCDNSLLELKKIIVRNRILIFIFYINLINQFFTVN